MSDLVKDFEVLAVEPDAKSEGDCCPECKLNIEHGKMELLGRALALQSSQRMLTPSQRAPLKKITQPQRHMVKFECEGEVGSVIELSQRADALFRGTDLRVFGPPRGARVLSFTINDKPQHPPTTEGFWSEVFQNPLGCGMLFDVINPDEWFKFRIEFHEAHKWMALLVGHKVLT